MRETIRDKEICSYLEKKLGKFKEYQSVTEKMKQTVCGHDETSRFSRLLNRRQKCIGTIEKINSCLEKILNSGSVNIYSISNKYKTLIEDYLLRIREVMMQVELMDRDLSVIVADQSESIKTELLNMRNKRQATKGYYSNKRYSPKFLDTRK